ncbi:hypothetical protein, partial [Streptomyces alfalfae]|uniref:hypothetical protein n=1 Tax=Streptomyces alfalfae TaxID=1642299 RepID=UPI0028118B58
LVRAALSVSVVTASREKRPGDPDNRHRRQHPVSTHCERHPPLERATAFRSSARLRYQPPLDLPVTPKCRFCTAD